MEIMRVPSWRGEWAMTTSRPAISLRPIRIASLNVTPFVVTRKAHSNGSRLKSVRGAVAGENACGLRRGQLTQNMRQDPDVAVILDRLRRVHAHIDLECLSSARTFKYHTGDGDGESTAPPKRGTPRHAPRAESLHSR